jgi:hypothetical protein
VLRDEWGTQICGDAGKKQIPSLRYGMTKFKES